MTQSTAGEPETANRLRVFLKLAAGSGLGCMGPGASLWASLPLRINHPVKIVMGILFVP